MPPPNITGQLHMGHAMFLTLQDIQTRFHGLIGDDTLWLPGTDHAGLATHAKIQEQMESMSIPLNDIEEYWTLGWKWKEHYHSRITTQIKKMGAACDWNQERFTLDNEYQASTKEAFKRCWEMGLIYHEDNQWWMNMESLATPLLEALENGELTIQPERSLGKLKHFLNNLEPWCLSRQIPWGMPIPLKLQEDGSWLFDESEATAGSPCLDTLDTWFLSSLWPFASLGWPDDSQKMDKYYPGEWMETGEDILFFWCARMWMMGKLLTGQWPFKTIFLHGMIRDKKGQKMSKSLGNGIDPLELIEKHGTDALRWHLAARASPALDMKFSHEAMKQDSAWLNKIWQAARFLNQFGPAPENLGEWPEDMKALSSHLSEELFANRFPNACRLLQKAFREDFCSGWIEHNKESLRGGDEELRREGWTRFGALLSLLHPFIPFMTSQLHEQLGLPKITK